MQSPSASLQRSYTLTSLLNHHWARCITTSLTTALRLIHHLMVLTDLMDMAHRMGLEDLHTEDPPVDLTEGQGIIMRGHLMEDHLTGGQGIIMKGHLMADHHTADHLTGGQGILMEDLTIGHLMKGQDIIMEGHLMENPLMEDHHMADHLTGGQGITQEDHTEGLEDTTMEGLGDGRILS